MPMDDSEENVDSIIDDITGWWDVAKLRSLFHPNLVAEIMKVMVFPGGTTDKLIWGQERSGIFSVKSCYKMIMSNNDSSAAESSSVEGQKKLWQALWKMPVPNKIKVLAWRACRDCLPSKDNLIKKNVVIDHLAISVSTQWRIFLVLSSVVLSSMRLGFIFSLL